MSKGEIAMLSLAVGMVLGGMSAAACFFGVLAVMAWFAVRLVHSEAVRTLQARPGDRLTLIHIAARAWGRTPWGRDSQEEQEITEVDLLDLEEQVLFPRVRTPRTFRQS